MQPRSPDFIGIGAQKAGTCWLRANLGRHPGVWMPPVRELHYFDRTLPGSPFPSRSALERAASESWRAKVLGDLRRQVAQGDASAVVWSALHHLLDHDEAWYRMQFALAPPSALVGDITPRYALCGEAEIAHMHAVAPKAKLLFLLRHPVERFWSQCQMKMADGSLPPGDGPAMRLLDSANGRPRGEYSQTLIRYCRHYDPNQILLVFLEGIQRDPVSVIRGVYRHLGLAEEPVDPLLMAEPVNAAVVRQPMAESLRARVAAAYQSEMELLAAVLGGHAQAWLDGGVAPTAPAVLPLSASLVDALQRHPRGPLGSRPGRPDRFFCLSMQRSGTTSVGDWLEAHGLPRAGHPTSARLGWSRLWAQGKQEAIFRSPEFQRAIILEDDPWWAPDYYRFLAERFPHSRFILLTRDADDWFDSLCHHSGGVNPGPTDLHARVYNRVDDLRALLAEQPALDPTTPGLLSLLGQRAHYTSMYGQHCDAVKDFFSSMPGRLFTGPLGRPQTFIDLCAFVGVTPNPAVAIPRSNARTAAMARRLAVHQGSRTAL
ncbi:MAG: sulfotransferase [Cyanobacteriota bacterium]|nr:sulfotransferase [Cyanobacteriota bacterium]